MFIPSFGSVFANVRCGTFPFRCVCKVEFYDPVYFTVSVRFNDSTVTRCLRVGDFTNSICRSFSYSVCGLVFLVPIYLVGMGNVFLCFPIMDRRPLVVTSRGNPLPATYHQGIRRTPSRIAPRRFAFLGLFPVLRVVVDLPIFKVPLPPQFQVPRQIYLLRCTYPNAVLTSTRLPLQVYYVLTICPTPRIVRIITVPTRVLIRDGRINRSIRIIVLVANSRDKATQIRLANRDVGLYHRAQEAIRPAKVCLVRRPPRRGTKIVMILWGRFLRLRTRIFVVDEVVRVGVSGEGLGPYRRSPLIRLLVRMFNLQVITGARNVTSRFLRRIRVFIVILQVGYQDTFHPILVPIRTVRAVELSVRGRAFLHVNVGMTRACLFFTTICLFPVLARCRRSFVWVKILRSVPRVEPFGRRIRRRLFVLARLYANGATGRLFLIV